MSIYVTYLTVYSGNKLPPFYIGSTSLDKIYKGYRGSVQSKKYKDIWKSELKQNPHLFKTKIISQHSDRKEALIKEDFLQRRLNAVESSLYINKSYSQPEGMFGLSDVGNHLKRKSNGYSIGGENNKKRVLLGIHQFQTRPDGTNINSDMVKNGTHHWLKRPDGSSNAKDTVINGTHSSHQKVSCIYCRKVYDISNFGRWHGSNCKYQSQ